MSKPAPQQPSPFAEALPADPLPVLQSWLDEATGSLAARNPTAMTLATVDPDGRPSARMVICRGFDAERGWLVFYTDRTSRKSDALRGLPRAALVFHWDALHRQVRVEGPVTTSPDAESDAYFSNRPLGAQLAAWASDQSAPIESREALLSRYEAARRNFAADESDTEAPGRMPRPPRWGGYRVWIERLEFWVGQPHRLHDRALFERTLAPISDGFKAGAWRATRLQP